MAKSFFRKKLLRFVPEATYGTDPGTGSLVDVITKELSISPFEAEELKLDEDKGVRGSDLSSHVGKHVLVTFKVRLSGAGSAAVLAGTPHKLDGLLLACGMKRTATAEVDCRYAPDDDADDSVTLRVYQGRQLHIITGARGGWKINGGNRKYTFIEFTMMGLYNAVTAVTVPAINMTGWQKPVVWSPANVAVSLAGAVVGCHEINIDGAQKPEFYEHSEAESIELDDFQARFDAQIEEPEIGTLDIYAMVASETTGALSYVHGTVTGNIFEVVSTMTQLVAPLKREDVKGVSALRVQGPMVMNGASPAFELVFK